MSAVKKIVFSLLAMMIAILLLTGVVYAAAAKTGIITGDVVNLRANPNTSAKILKQLDKNTKVSVVGSEGDWYRISIGEDRYGWVNSEYLSIKNDIVSRGLTIDVKTPVQAAAVADDKVAVGSDEGEAAVESDKAGDRRQEIIAYARTLLGIKYVYGGSSTKGFDCSGFVGYVFKHFGIILERASRDMGSYGTAVKKADLQPGDLVFFDTNGGLNGINHVGIYIGNNKFIHASSVSGRKVTISSLSDSFYSKTYMRARDYVTE